MDRTQEARAVDPSSRVETPPIVIPIRNEAERIISCLQSFASQDYGAPFDLLLLLNNCTDRTGGLIRAFAGPPAMRLHVHERLFPAHQGNAGYARHSAMQG